MLIAVRTVSLLSPLSPLSPRLRFGIHLENAQVSLVAAHNKSLQPGLKGGRLSAT
jgi:hypothetical protein